jgi:hypothetical protein
MKKSYAQFIPIISACLLLAGCTGYDFTPSLPAGIERIALQPIVNQTSEEALEIELTKAVLSYLHTSAHVQLTSNPTADALIEITITSYANRPLAFKGSDRQVPPSAFNQRITAIAALRNVETQNVINSVTNYGEAFYHFESDLPTSKRANRKKALEELARTLCLDLLDPWE